MGLVVIENPFGICKARWRCLLNLTTTLENVSNVIITCFTLHNFYQLNGETYFDADGILGELIENQRRAWRRTSGTVMPIPIDIDMNV